MSDYNVSLSVPSTHLNIVIFTGGLFPDPCATAGYWNLFPSEYVITADSGLETARQYAAFFKAPLRFTPDEILGDFDSISDRSLLSQYPPSIIQTFPADKDWTDTELALHHAYDYASAQRQIPHITLVGGDGGRIDHLLGIYDSFAAPYHADVWLCSCQAVWLLAAGQRAEISGLGSRDIISVARTTKSRTGGTLHSEGLVWEDTVFRNEGMPSISNRSTLGYADTGKPVLLTAEKSDFLIICPLSASVRICGKESLRNGSR